MNKFCSAITFFVLCMSAFAEEKNANETIKVNLSSVAFVEAGSPGNIKDQRLAIIYLINKSPNRIALSRNIEALNISKDGIPIVHMDYACNAGEFVDVDPGKALKTTLLLKRHKLDATRGKQTKIVVRSLDRITKQESTESIRVEFVDCL